MLRYIIIGAGAAGISSAETIHRQDPSGEIILISEEPDGYYSRPGLAYYLTGEIPERQLFPNQDKYFENMRLRRIVNSVTSIDPTNHQIHFVNGKVLPYDRILIATGSQAVAETLSGAELDGVVKLDNINDARHILKLARHTKDAVVSGGGITALEIVEGLRERGVRVHYLLRKNRYWSNVLDETESEIVEKRLKGEGIKIYYQAEMVEIIGRSGKVRGIRMNDGREIACQMVAIAIGVKPRLELARASKLNINRGIIVNEHLQTSEADIFAAGDVAEVYDPVSGKTILDTLWAPACSQGRVAGINMAGKNVSWKKQVSFNVTRLAGLTTTIIGTVGGRDGDADTIGIVRGDSETWRQMPDAITAQTNFDVNRLRLLIKDNHLVGAIVMGDQTLSRPILQMVTENVDISEIQGILIGQKAKMGETIMDFWLNWKERHAH